MGKSTEISWCRHTFNPWWGCIRVSAGCEHCYAETFAKRTGHAIWGPSATTDRRLFGPKHWAEPFAWNKAATEAGERRTVFCASMADVFEDNSYVADARLQLWSLIDSTRSLDWLLLTKRPENVMRMIPPWWREKLPDNVWLGTSVETQEYMLTRVPELCAAPARVRFLSVEPQLGPVTLTSEAALLVDWVIVGGESGPKHRPFDLGWARSLRDECSQHNIAFHFKQFGGMTHAAGGCLLDGREYKEFPTNGLREVVPL